MQEAPEIQVHFPAHKLTHFLGGLRSVFVAAHGLSLVVVHRLLVAVASLVVEHGL